MGTNDEKIPGQEPSSFLINMPQKFWGWIIPTVLSTRLWHRSEKAEKPGFVMRFTNKDSFGTVAAAEFWERPHYAVKGLCRWTEPSFHIQINCSVPIFYRDTALFGRLLCITNYSCQNQKQRTGRSLENTCIQNNAQTSASRKQKENNTSGVVQTRINVAENGKGIDGRSLYIVETIGIHHSLSRLIDDTVIAAGRNDISKNGCQQHHNNNNRQGMWNRHFFLVVSCIKSPPILWSAQ